MSKGLEIFRNNWKDPFREISSLHHSMQNWFDDFYRAAPAFTKNSGDFFAPTCEVEETDGGYHFKFDLPGVTKDQIKIDLKENQLTVSAERKEEKKSDNNNRHFSEISYGSYVRSFALPSTVDSEKVEAKYENGVLAINIPKSAATKARQITVK